MRKCSSIFAFVFLCSLFSAGAHAADFEPTDIQQPGTQPGEVSNLESPDKCDNCHGGYNKSVEPAYNWRGSMMGNAGRDPIFWATMAVAEQDFDGAGDLCIRCHSTGGWYAGRSVPTDGSALTASDSDGVDCDTCHKMTNPDDTEYQGVMFPPFIANNGVNEAYYGSGMLSLWGGTAKLGPYGDAQARHQFGKSAFHRSADFCGSCHDVSNAVVGDLAPGNGTQPSAEPVTASGVLGGPVENKAAFNNPPYKYGIVERTFSEFKAGALPTTLVSAYESLPADLKGGAIKAAYESATASGGSGNYADGSARYFSCQTCHLRPVNGAGCNKQGVPTRNDLPLHDMTGGNYWMGDAIIYQNNNGLLLLGGNMTALQIEAVLAGKVRAMKQLSEAVTLSVANNKVHLVNHTGHKLISGYPEGRRMWLNVKWYSSTGDLVREDGAYGPVATVTNPADGTSVQVESIINLEDPNTKIYETHYGMTQQWAESLLALHPADLPLTYDRFTGNTELTLGALAAMPPGSTVETFHFALNNTVVKDNRIPPYGFKYETARVRNALPVPAVQYGNPGPGGTYNYFDDVALSTPVGAVYADIQLLYQPTSWEYILFLYKANNGANVFLADEGRNMLEAWLNTGMAKPYVMAATTWGNAPTPPTPELYAANLSTWSVNKQGNLLAESSTFAVRDTVAIMATVVEEGSDAPVAGAQVFMEVRNAGGSLVTTLQGFTDESGQTALRWKTGRNAAAGMYTASITNILHNSYAFDSNAGQTSVSFTLQ